MIVYNSPYTQALEATDISAQFEGFEIEFDDKVTLFPVQVEKQNNSRRRSQEFSRAKTRAPGRSVGRGLGSYLR